MMDIEHTVRERYSKALGESSPDLCCPTSYDPALLSVLPDEILEKDFGCGDPSRFVHEGDRVLDLGCGAGKICYIAAQKIGPEGWVFGLDMNDDMLALARKYQAEMAEKLGSDHVRFLKGYIQDLSLDLELMDSYLAAHPIGTVSDFLAFQAWQETQRSEQPLIPSESIDLVVSNCVLNLVRDSDKEKMVREIVRVLKPGGRVALSDIVSDEEVPDALKKNPELWSGCLSGAFREDLFLRVFEEAGLAGIRIDAWGGDPWKTISGIEFRSVTLTAFKPLGTECLDRGHAVIYRGPFKETRDEEGHIFPRGERIAVCERTYRTLMEGPYRDDFIGIAPEKLWEGRKWCAPPGTRRSSQETKGGSHASGTEEGKCCP
ncbi:MAG: methyltransferase domain-containing protein [Leptospirales bacterium]